MGRRRTAARPRLRAPPKIRLIPHLPDRRRRTAVRLPRRRRARRDSTFLPWRTRSPPTPCCTATFRTGPFARTDPDSHLPGRIRRYRLLHDHRRRVCQSSCWRSGPAFRAGPGAPGRAPAGLDRGQTTAETMSPGEHVPFQLSPIGNPITSDRQHAGCHPGRHRRHHRRGDRRCGHVSEPQTCTAPSGSAARSTTRRRARGPRINVGILNGLAVTTTRNFASDAEKQQGDEVDPNKEKQSDSSTRMQPKLVNGDTPTTDTPPEGKAASVPAAARPDQVRPAEAAVRTSPERRWAVEADRQRPDRPAAEARRRHRARRRSGTTAKAEPKTTPPELEEKEGRPSGRPSSRRSWVSRPGRGRPSCSSPW